MMQLLRGGVLVWLLAMVGDATATSYVRPPTMEDLAKVWIGAVPKGILQCYRLELDAKGVGLLTVQYLPHEPAVAYRVTETTLSKYDVNFVLQPLDRDAEPIYLRGQAIRISLDLETGGTNGKWKRPVFFQVESTLQARVKAVADAAERWHRKLE